jgi:hypothetical protein
MASRRFCCDAAFPRMEDYFDIREQERVAV